MAKEKNGEGKGMKERIEEEDKEEGGERWKLRRIHRNRKGERDKDKGKEKENEQNRRMRKTNGEVF